MWHVALSGTFVKNHNSTGSTKVCPYWQYVIYFNNDNTDDGDDDGDGDDDDDYDDDYDDDDDDDDYVYDYDDYEDDDDDHSFQFLLGVDEIIPEQGDLYFIAYDSKV